MAWLSAWDYFPLYSARAGAAGIVAGTGPLPCELEFDYFLLKAGGLSQIKVKLPPQKPARAVLSAVPHLEANSLTLRLEGEPGAHYRIDTSTNFVDWQRWSTVILTNGAAETTDHGLWTQQQRFYQAHYLGL